MEFWLLGTNGYFLYASPVLIYRQRDGCQTVFSHFCQRPSLLKFMHIYHVFLLSAGGELRLCGGVHLSEWRAVFVSSDQQTGSCTLDQSHVWTTEWRSFFLLLKPLVVERSAPAPPPLALIFSCCYVLEWLNQDKVTTSGGGFPRLLTPWFRLHILMETGFFFALRNSRILFILCPSCLILCPIM